MLSDAHNCIIHGGTFINVEGNINNQPYNAKDLDVARLQEALSIMSSEISILKSRDIQSKQELLYHKILRWLSPLRFRQRQHDIFARRVHSTGEWLLNSKEYRAWQSGSSARVLWCPGKPGAGKTILSSIVINHLQSHTHNTGDALMFIFCDYKERREQTYANLITSLLSQLLEERCERMGDSQDRFMVSEHVMELYERHTRRKTRPSNEEFLETLRIEIGKFYSSAFIVLDALDEGPEDERTQSNLVFDLRNLGGAVRLLVTSRDLPPIARLMDGVPRLPIQARNGDIQKYIENQLSTTPRLWRLLEGNSELREILIATLSGNCSGMFLVVKLHMDALAKQNNVTAIQDALLNLPQGVDAIYDDIINRIRAQAEPDKHLAETTLAWVAYGRRPLSVTELRCALSENKGPSSLLDLEVIVSACAGIIVVDEGSQNVRFIHQTVQEYFDRNQASRFPLVHDELARKCVEYLSATCSQGPCRRRIHLLDRMEQHPLLDYAANNWGWHVRASKKHKVMLAMTVDFMKEKPLFGAASQILLRKESTHRWIGYSMWHATTYFDLHAVALHFLKCGILPDAEGVHEHVLLYAVRHRSNGVLKVLIQHKFDINMKDIYGRTPLSQAVVWETGLEIVRFLLAEQEIDVNSKAKNRRTPLSYAVEEGSVEIVELLLAREDVAINSKDKKGRTPFSYAVRKRRVEIVKLLIAREDVDVNSKDKYGQMPLLDATGEESVEIVKLLLAREDVDVNSKDNYGQTSLSYAVESGSAEIVKSLLARDDLDVKSKDRDGQTPLSCAVKSGRHVEIVELLLLREDVDINSKDKNGRTPFSYAVGRGNVSVMAKALLARIDVDINLKDKNGRTPFSHAVERGSVEIVQLLLAREDVDLKLKDKNGRAPFSYALEGGNTRIVELLLARKDVDVNLKDKHGRSPFSYVVEGGNDRVVELLLSREDVDVKMKAKNRQTHFSYAVNRGSVMIVDLLLAQGDVDINLRDRDGRTPFSHAVETGSVKILQLLLARADTDINLKDKNERTPFSHAIERGSVEIIELLLAREDVDVKSKDSSGRTPFSYAVRRRTIEIVKLLIVREDVDVNSKDNNGNIPLSDAIEKGSVEIVRLLLAREDIDVNSKDNHGRTPFSYAVRGESVQIAQLLLAREDIDVKAKDNYGRTPFSYAVWGEKVEIVKLLLAREDVDANSKSNYGRTPFSYAVRGKCVETVKLLLAREDIDVNSKSNYGRTPFSYAVEGESVKIVELLLAREDVDINSKDKDGRIPFSHVFVRGSVDIVKLLLMRDDLDVNFKNKYGRTHLWDAINARRSDSGERLELLLSHPRTKVDIRDKLGRTPLSDAAAHGNFEVVELLLGHGAAVDTRDYFGLTPRLRAQFSLWGQARRVVSLLDAFQHR